MVLAEQVKHRARELGFGLAGVAPVGPATTHKRYLDWLAHRYHGKMGYMARPDAVARRADVRELLPSARSIVVVGINYYQEIDDGSTPGVQEEQEGWGRVARYAWGDDYHAVIIAKLEQLAEFVQAQAGRPVEFKVCVDTSAILEREWAVRAGLGWIGKNTLLINPQAGSWFLLGELLLDLDLEYDQPFATDHCGTCTRCLDACPTHCILPGRELDASRCISYLTIELRDEIPTELREQMGDWIFGCDICQEVCPWNRFARRTSEPAFAPRNTAIDVRELAGIDEETFRARFVDSPIRRARRTGLARNGAVVAANQESSREN